MCWLVAAEIATAQIAGRSSRLVKSALQMIESAGFSEFDTAELAAALATLEAESGNRRRGTKLFRASLRDPTENAIAQASWAVRYGLCSLELPQGLVWSPEAIAWNASEEGDWANSAASSQLWLQDQPFSSRPAIRGSFVAALGLFDFDLSLRFTEWGLVANPGSPMLLNNRAFALAKLGRIAEATDALSLIGSVSLTSGEAIALEATKGLIAYGSGRIEEARKLYAAASLAAADSGDEKRCTMALLWQALEELKLGNLADRPIIARAITKAETQRGREVQSLLAHVLASDAQSHR